MQHYEKHQLIEIGKNNIVEIKQRERQGRDKGADAYIQDYMQVERECVHKAEVYAVSRYLAPSSSDKILDICCGSGRVALELGKLVREIIGIDISTQAISNFNKNMKMNNLNGKGYVRDICELRSDIGIFDNSLLMSSHPTCTFF